MHVLQLLPRSLELRSGSCLDRECSPSKRPEPIVFDSSSQGIPSHSAVYWPNRAYCGVIAERLQEGTFNHNGRLLQVGSAYVGRVVRTTIAVAEQLKSHFGRSVHRTRPNSAGGRTLRKLRHP